MLERLQLLLDFFRSLPQPLAYVAAALSAIWFAYKYRGAIRRLFASPRLRNPDALKLDARYQFATRAADAANLRRLLDTTQLIFLLGEPGIGKSYVLQSALLPILRTDHIYFPVLIDTWHPSGGIEQATLAGRQLHSALTGTARESSASRADSLPAPGDLIGLIRFVRQVCGKIPVLLLDQFEDSPLQGSQLWVDDGVVATPDAIAAADSFWGVLAKLLRAGEIKCVFALRHDTIDGPLHFTPAREYRLFRQPQGSALASLEWLVAHSTREGASTSAVEDVDDAFAILQEELCRDLERHHQSAEAASSSMTPVGLLPIELEMALLGLRWLPKLTVRGYIKEGRISGLVRGYLRHLIAEAARTHKLSLAQGIRAVLCLTDTTTSTVATPARTTGEILDLLGETAELDQQRFRTKLAGYMSELERLRVVRRRSLSACGGPTWQLYHAYLGNAIANLEAEIRGRHVRAGHIFDRYLRTAYPLARVRALATLRELPEVLSAVGELRGRQGYANFVALSTIRAGVLFGTVGWPVATGLAALRASNAAEAIVESFDDSDELSRQEVNALWAMTRAPAGVIEKLVPRFRRSLADTNRLVVHLPYVLNAMRGLERQDRTLLMRRIYRMECVDYHPSDAFESVCASLGALLGEGKLETLAAWLTSHPVVRPKSEELRSLVASIADRDRPVAASLVAQAAIRWSSPALATAHHEIVTESLLGGVDNSLRVPVALARARTDVGGLAVAALMLELSGGSLGDEDKEQLWALLQSRVVSTLDERAYGSLPVAVAALAQMNSEEARNLQRLMIGRLLPHMRERSGVVSYWVLGMMSTMHARLEPSERMAVAEAMVALTLDDAFSTRYLVWSERRPELWDELSKDQRKVLAARVLERCTADFVGAGVGPATLRWLEFTAQDLDDGIAHSALARVFEACQKSDGRARAGQCGTIVAVLAQRLGGSTDRAIAEYALQDLGDEALLGEAEDARVLAALRGSLSASEGAAAGTLIFRALLRSAAGSGDMEAVPTYRDALMSLKFHYTREALAELRDALTATSSPRCEAAVILASNGEERYVIEQLLKWPHCTEASRLTLIGEIEKRLRRGASDVQGNTSSMTQLLGFVDWARSAGFDVDSPPVQSRRF